MNWKKTEEFYRAEGYIYPEEKTELTPRNQLYTKKKQELIDLEKWETRVMNKDGKYKNRSNDATVYPIKRLVQLKRIRWIDGKEYIKSFWDMIGVDNIGNQVGTTVQDQEVHIRPQFVKRLIVNRDTGEQETKITEALEDEKVFTVPFTPEEVDKYLEGQNVRRVSLVVAEETETGTITPRQVTNLDHFKNKPFDDLYYVQQPATNESTKRAR
jgi:hypothetical protein